MLVLGDAHAADPTRRQALDRAYRSASADVALQVGDLQAYDLPVPTWFVAGNDDDLDVIERLRRGEAPDGATNARLIASEVVTVNGLRVAGLSGNYAPTQYEKDRAALSGDRRRHFTHEDVEAAMELPADIDVFLAHEAPHGLLEVDGYDVGCRPMDRILERLEPRLCLIGHHHEHAQGTFGPSRTVALAPVWEGYYRLDPSTLELERREPPEAT